MAFRLCCKLVLCLCIRVGWWGGIQAVCSKLVLCHCIRVGWWGGIQAVQQACFVPLY